MLKVLYISCHITLESDELEMISSLGLSVVSVGNFILPSEPFSEKKGITPTTPWCMYDWREPNINRDLDLTNEFLHMNPNFKGVDLSQNLNISRKYLEKFDAIVVSHSLKYLTQVLQLRPKCPVIYCTVGQVSAGYENTLRPVRDLITIVRYCEGEEKVTNCVGTDAYISGSVNDDFLNIKWIGDWPQIMTVSRAMPIRPRETSYPTFLEIAQPFSAKIYGSGNELVPPQYNGGKLSYSELIEAYSRSRVFIATGTCPGTITYTFIEALGLGMPVIGFGPNLARRFIRRDNMYIIDKHIEKSQSGFYSDSIPELQDRIRELLKNDKLCQELSLNGKKYVKENFSRSVVTQKWRNLFKQKGLC